MLTQVHLLKKYGVRVRGHLGQHLLMDPNTVRKIVDGLKLEKGETVLEVGPGLGALTAELLSRGHRVIAIEKDPKFIEILENELLPEYPEAFKLVHSDILKTDLTKMLGSDGGCRMEDDAKPAFTLSAIRHPSSVFLKIKVVSNLPYYISTPILFHLIEHRVWFHSAVLMMQKEVAARMTAKPRTEDYGRLSVSSALFGKTETLFDVSPKCFLPAPEVTSRVIRYTFERGSIPEGEDFLLEVVRIAFSERRKTLLSLFLKYLRPKRTRPELEAVFRELGFTPSVRGEELAKDAFVALSEALKKAA